MVFDSSSKQVGITDASQVRNWIVCESNDRWLIAIRRFVLELMPDHLVASIMAAQLNQSRSLLTGRRQTIVFWEVNPQNLMSVLQVVAQTSIASPGVLQLAAVEGISQASQIALSELGVATQIRRPEQLPSLAGMVNRYLNREPSP